MPTNVAILPQGETADPNNSIRVKGQLQRIEQQQVHLNEARAKLDDAQDTIKDLSREVNRLRIEREQLRENLSARKAPPQSEQQEAPAPVVSNPADAEADGEVKEPQNAREARKMSFAKLEREVEKARENEGGYLCFFFTCLCY